MPKTAALPATADAIALLANALAAGHSVTLSLATEPRVIRAPPAITTCCLRFGLTPSEARVLLPLLEHGFVGNADLHHAMSRDGYTVSDIKTLRVVICKIRQKLAACGIRIITVWKAGYRLDEKDRGKIREMLTETTHPSSEA
jgi:hypothetical protein